MTPCSRPWELLPRVRGCGRAGTSASEPTQLAALGCTGLCWAVSTPYQGQEKEQSLPSAASRAACGGRAGGGVPQGLRAASDIVCAGAPEPCPELPVPSLPPRTLSHRQVLPCSVLLSAVGGTRSTPHAEPLLFTLKSRA